MPGFWPYKPNALTETLEFATDIRMSKTAETRDSLKDATRYLDMVHSLPHRDAEQAVELYKSNPLGEWVVPVWPEMSKGGALLSGATTITCDTNASYRVGGYVFVGQGGAGEFKTVATLGSGSLTITTGLGSAYSAPMVAPAEQCYCPEGVGIGKAWPLSNLSLSFLSLEPVDLAGPSYPTHAGYSVITDKGVLLGTRDGGITRAAEVLQSRMGVFALYETESYTRRRGSVQFLDQANRYDRRKLLHYLRGRDRAAWFPSWQNDLPLQSAVSSGDTTIAVKQLAPTSGQLIGRSIQIRDGSTLYHRTITNASTFGGNHTLTIASGVTAATDAQVSLMTLSRLDEDRITLQHQFADGGMITTFSAPTIEVPA